MRSTKITILLVLTLMAMPALAGLELADQRTKTVGATTVTWDSSWHDFDYTRGNAITMEVTWAVDAGVAVYRGFDLKRFTPKSKKDPANGQLLSVTPDPSGANKVVVQFKFTDLHLDKTRNVDIGNAHFKLLLWIDKDGDGVVESVVGYGVNVHVEDPQ